MRVSPHAPNFHDAIGAHADWQMCAHVIAGQPAQRVMVRRDGRGTYPATAQRPLSASPPSAPAAVMLWDHAERLHTLALDFDAKNGNGPRTAAKDAHAALTLLSTAGLHPFADRGPTGGWHVYAPLPEPRTGPEVLILASALARRFPSLDVGPLANSVHGCIRPPGAAHKSGGYQRLVSDPQEVALALTTPPNQAAWARLSRALSTEIAALRAPDEPKPQVPAAAGVRRRALANDAETLAATGHHPHRTFPSPSEARYSVICHAINAGWSLADVYLAIRDRWPWLRDSYATKHHSALARDFTKAKEQRARALSSRHVRPSDTSHQHTQRGVPPALDVHLALRRFRTFTTEHGRIANYSPTLRAVLAAVLWAGHVQGRTLINTGVRSLAEQSDVHFDTAAAHLHQLADDGLLTRISRGRGLDPDVWRINVELAATYRPAPGRAHGIRPVFRVLGGHMVAEVYENLPPTKSDHRISAADLAQRLGYDRRRVHEALRLLQGYQLAANDDGAWEQGSADPDALGRRLGGHEDWQRQHHEHLRHRAAWRERLNNLHKSAPPLLRGQLAWEAEFALVDEQDHWIEDLAGGSPPNRRTSHAEDRALNLVRTALGGVVVA